MMFAKTVLLLFCIVHGQEEVPSNGDEYICMFGEEGESDHLGSSHTPPVRSPQCIFKTVVNHYDS